MITKFEPDVYYTLNEIVQRTGYNVQTFRRWIHSGKIKGQKTGREYLVPGIELNNVFGINEMTLLEGLTEAAIRM